MKTEKAQFLKKSRTSQMTDNKIESLRSRAAGFERQAAELRARANALEAKTDD